MGAGSDVWQWILTDWVQSAKYDENHSKPVPRILKSWLSRWNSMFGSVVSKAADKCKRVRRETFPALTIFRSAVSVLCPGR